MTRLWTSTRILWGALGLLYLAFLSWYDWSGGPLTPKEIDSYVARLEAQGLEATRVPEMARAFAEGDDGEEFFMVNLENQRDQPLIPDDMPADTDPYEAERRYSRATGLKLLARAGHPVMAIRGRVNFIDYDGAPVWENLLLVRYRSRRDFFEIFSHPETAQGIRYKFVFYGLYHAWPTETTFNIVGIRAQVLIALLVMGLPIHLLLVRRSKRAGAGNDS